MLNEADRVAALPLMAETLLRSLVAQLYEVEEIYPELPRSDVRRAGLHKLINSVFPTHFHLLFLREQLFDPSWWVQRGRGLYSPDDLAITLEEFENNAKFCALMSSFSATESTFRTVAAVINPSPDGGHRSFKSCYDKLFAALTSPHSVGTMDLYRLLRNASHNNGVHSGRREFVHWRGDAYEFEQMQAVSFLTWEVLFSLIDDVAEITQNIMMHDLVRAVPSLKDPYAHE